MDTYLTESAMIRASLLGCVGMFALVRKGIGYSGPTTCHWIIWPTNLYYDCRLPLAYASMTTQ